MKSQGKPFDYDLLCLGSGPAGQRAAVQAAKLHKRVAVIESARGAGGVCVGTGTIPSKTFREAVLAAAQRRETTHEGLEAPPGRPSAAELLGRVNDVVCREAEVIQDQLGRNDVALFHGVARFVDAHTVAVENEHGRRLFSAEKLVIAVGTRPAPPPCADRDGLTVITSDGVLGMQKLPRSMVVVGAGVIGLEYASMFAHLGVSVTIVDRRERPLEFLDRELVDELIHQLRQKNAIYRGGESVASVELSKGTPRRAAVVLESGKRLVADLVLFSIGRQGNTTDLNLAAAGLEADERGRITVDEHFCTSVPHIHAAGDVIGFPSLAATSSEQGRLAACHAFDVEAEPMTPHFPIGIYAIPELSMVGETEEQLTEKKVPYETGIARYREIARGQILRDDTGFLKLIFQRETKLLLGVHVVGTGATELVHIGQAVLRLGGGLDYFLKTIFNYPTLAECYKVAALNASNKLAW